MISLPRQIKLLRREPPIETNCQFQTWPTMSNPPTLRSKHLNIPATSVEEFLDLEREIRVDSAKESIYVNELRATNAATLEKYVRECLRKIITDDAASHFSWRGHRENIAVKSFTVLNILRDEANFKYYNTLGSDVEDVIKNWFRYAKDRFNKRNKKYK